MSSPLAQSSLIVAIGVCVGCTINVNQTSGASGQTDTVDEQTSEGGSMSSGSSGDAMTTDDPVTTGTTDATTGKSTSDGTATDATTTDGTTTDSTTTNGTATDATTTDGTATDATTGDDTTTGGIMGSCPDGWTRGRVVTITNAPNKPLDDYQAMIAVDWDDDMQVDFADIRFVDGQGALLPHWIEDYTAPLDALVWVRVPEIAPATTTLITMCYGNPDAMDSSDGYTTFDFFDGFEGDSLDASKWLSTFPASLESGYLKVAKGSVYSKGSPGHFPNSIVEAKARATPNSGNEGPGLQLSSAQSQVAPTMWMALGAYYVVATADPPMTVLAGNFDKQNCCSGTQDTVYGLAVDDGNVYVYAKRTHTATALATWSKPFFIGLGFNWMKDSGAKDISDMMVDWVLVRKFTSIAPTSEVGPELVL